MARFLSILAFGGCVLTLGAQQASSDFNDGLAAGRMAGAGAGGAAFGWTLGVGGVLGCCAGGCIPYKSTLSGCAYDLPPYVAIGYACVGGALGGGLAGAIVASGTPAPPPQLLFGKSQDYVAGFTQGYTEEAKKQRQSKALTGTVVGAGLAAVITTVMVLIIVSMGTS
jgi:hypothetical protein